MIPDLIEINGAPWKVLPPGFHVADFEEIETVYGFNEHRRNQLLGLRRALRIFSYAGCRFVFLDGSFVTSKPLPGDYDCCWDTNGVDIGKLDPVFLDFSNKRAEQKRNFFGEFFPAYLDAGNGQIFIDFFRTEKHTGEEKGIIQIDISIGYNN